MKKKGDGKKTMKEGEFQKMQNLKSQIMRSRDQWGNA